MGMELMEDGRRVQAIVEEALKAHIEQRGKSPAAIPRHDRLSVEPSALWRTL